jgi:predicted RNase H-like HicB family nuclease
LHVEVIFLAAISLPPLTALIHQEKLSDGSPVWVAHCPELDIVSQGFSSEEARMMLQEAVELFLEVALPAEVEARLAEGYTPTIEELKVAA